MNSVSKKQVITISRAALIDDHSLRRASLARFLESGTDGEGFVFHIVEAVDAPNRIESPENLNLIILGVGGTPTETPEIQEQLKELASRMPDVPVVVISDREAAEDVVAVLRAGARGFITTRMEPKLMILALQFIIAGGVFFPPDALLHESKDAAATRGTAEPDIGADTAIISPATFESLTLRQEEVLRLLRQGQSNKQIARALRMCESTVKVHVRQIMRKLGVSNRTQAAICTRTPPSASLMSPASANISLICGASAMESALLPSA